MMPFPGGIESHSNGTLALSVVAALYYLYLLDRPASWRRTAVKTAAVGLLAVLVFLEHGPWLLTLALIACAAGDALLSRDGPRAFLGGLGAFLIGHVLYAGLFFTAGSPNLLMSEPWRLLVAGIAAVFAGVMVLKLRPALDASMRLPVTAYIAAILAMAVSALTVGGIWIAAGAVLFMASDAILATERFLLSPMSSAARIMQPAVWILYYLAQTAIVLGAVYAG